MKTALKIEIRPISDPRGIWPVIATIPFGQPLETVLTLRYAASHQSPAGWGIAPTPETAYLLQKKGSLDGGGLEDTIRVDLFLVGDREAREIASMDHSEFIALNGISLGEGVKQKPCAAFDRLASACGVFDSAI